MNMKQMIKNKVKNRKNEILAFSTNDFEFLDCIRKLIIRKFIFFNQIQVANTCSKLAIKTVKRQQ